MEKGYEFGTAFQVTGVVYLASMPVRINAGFRVESVAVHRSIFARGAILDAGFLVRISGRETRLL